MKDGRIQYQGTLSEVKKQEPELYESWRLALREAKASESRSGSFLIRIKLNTDVPTVKWFYSDQLDM